MSVDYSALANKLGFDERYIEKACRVSDLLQRVSQVPFLRDSYPIWWDCAAFIHFQRLIDYPSTSTSTIVTVTQS
jgi:hypothetical protein